MRIEFDSRKYELNQAKHGVSLALATALDWDAALVWLDEREDYGAQRMIALAPLDDRLYCVVFVVRRSVHRIISLRRANQREAKHYAQAI